MTDFCRLGAVTGSEGERGLRDEWVLAEPRVVVKGGYVWLGLVLFSISIDDLEAGVNAPVCRQY